MGAGGFLSYSLTSCSQVATRLAIKVRDGGGGRHLGEIAGKGAARPDLAVFTGAEMGIALDSPTGVFLLGGGVTAGYIS